MFDNPAIRHAINEREERLASFYQMQRRAGSSPVEANELMGEFAKRLDRLERDRRAADDAFNRELSIIKQCMESVADDLGRMGQHHRQEPPLYRSRSRNGGPPRQDDDRSAGVRH